MFAQAETKPAKRAVNLRVDSKMLDEAKALDINLSAALEQALSVALRAQREAKWLEENKAGIEAYNEHVRKHGLWNDSFRPF